MTLRLLLLAAIAFAQLRSAVGATIDHDKVQPFPQPEPVTVSEKAAIKFKPNLIILDACHPYPAVNAAGETSGGLKGTGKRNGACKGSGLGSQVYGRAGWHDDMWAIMFAWYFPKDVYYRGLFSDKGYRHKWVSAVVWLDNPALEGPKVLAVSTSVGTEGGVYGTLKNAPQACGRNPRTGYQECSPPFAGHFNGTSPNVIYQANGEQPSSLNLNTLGGGELQDLIMWEQLTEEARDALSTTDFGETKVPFIDANFNANLEAARPSV